MCKEDSLCWAKSIYFSIILKILLGFMFNDVPTPDTALPLQPSNRRQKVQSTLVFSKIDSYFEDCPTQLSSSWINNNGLWHQASLEAISCFDFWFSVCIWMDHYITLHTSVYPKEIGGPKFANDTLQGFTWWTENVPSLSDLWDSAKTSTAR